jgi:hypothetical protein
MTMIRGKSSDKIDANRKFLPLFRQIMEMALSYTVDVAARMVLVTYRIQPDFAEMRETLEAAFKDPNYELGFGILLDGHLVTRPAQTNYVAKVVHLIDSLQNSEKTTQWALFAPDLSSFGMGRMAEQLTKYPGSIRVFKDRAEAEKWLAATG